VLDWDHKYTDSVPVKNPRANSRPR